MEHQHKEFSFKRIFSSGLWVFLTGFSWELVEEILESVIAEALTDLIALFIAKVFLTFAVILSTQLVKKLLKKILRPIIKRLTYKEGNDKVSKIKSFFQWLFANKKTLCGIAGAGVATLSGTGVIDVSVLPALVVGGLNITPFIYYGVLLVVSLIGISGKGFESVKTFFERIAGVKAEKEQKAIVREAQKELKAEQKVANQTQAQQEKAQAKADAQKVAEEEKAKAEAEHRAKIEQAKAEIKAQLEAQKKVDNGNV